MTLTYFNSGRQGPRVMVHGLQVKEEAERAGIEAAQLDKGAIASPPLPRVFGSW